MMKQARTLLSRRLSDSLFQGNLRASTIRGFAATADGKDAPKSTGRVFASYTIFKGKAALSVEPVLPTFTKVEAGLRIDRGGSVMMTFMPSIGERKYDYEKRQLFALSPTEVGSFISMSSTETSEFFHDPSMKSSNAGQVRKSLSIKPHADGSGYFISLSVTNNITKTSDFLVVPVTKAEFAVLKTAFSYALPHIMGWDRLTSQGSTETQGIRAAVADPEQLSLEWDKTDQSSYRLN